MSSFVYDKDTLSSIRDPATSRSGDEWGNDHEILGNPWSWSPCLGRSNRFAKVY
jgi:hypothetical protein